MRTRPILVLLGISLLWGSGWMLAPLLAETTAPFAGAALLFALAALLLAPFGLMPRSPVHATRATVVLGATMLALPLPLLLLAAQHGVSGGVPLLYSLLPLFAALEGWSAATVCAPGAALVLLNGTVPFTAAKLGWAVPALGAVMLQAFALRYAARALAGWPIRAVLRSLAVQCALAAAVLAAASAAYDHAPRILSGGQWPAASIAAACVLAALATVLPYAGLYWLLAGPVLQPVEIATAQWLQLLVAAGESALVAHTRPPVPVLLAGVCLMGCTGAVLRAQPDTRISLGDASVR